MASVADATRALAFIAALVFGVILGRPLYWGLQARVHDSIFEPESPTVENANSGISPIATELSISSHSVTPSTIANAGSGENRINSNAAVPADSGTVKLPFHADATLEGARKSPGNDASANSVVAQPEPGLQQPVITDQNDESNAIGTEKQGVAARLMEDWPLAPALRHKVHERPAPGTELPPIREFMLRRSLLSLRADRNNTVVVSFANHAFLDFVHNWVGHLTRVGVENLLVGAMDNQLLSDLFFSGIPTFDMSASSKSSGVGATDSGWGTPVFYAIGRERVVLLDVVLSLGFNVFITDTDVVFVQNPLPFLWRYPEADILASSDLLVDTTPDDQLEEFNKAWAPLNVGILFFRNTPPARQLASNWTAALSNNSRLWEQNAFNDLIRSQGGGYGPSIVGGRGLHWAQGRSIRVGILPVTLFCSGHTYFIQRLHRAANLQPIAVHATFQYSGTAGKRHRFREALLFDDPPHYYDPPGGVLSYDAELTDEILSEGEHTLQSHFRLMNYQLVSMRSALAIALALNRTLVFPPVWARFDRIWWPHKGTEEGTDTPQPLVVPLDHLLKIDKMLPGALDENEFGPSVPFRESSFFRNPLVSSTLLTSKLSVRVCNGACSASSRFDDSVVFVPNKLTQAQVTERLATYSDRKWLHFDHMHGLFAGWDDAEAKRKFKRRLSRYSSLWCCVNSHPGHIYYDFWADEKPGWRPRPPANRSVDHPPLYE